MRKFNEYVTICALVGASFLFNGCATTRRSVSYIYDFRALSEARQIECKTTNFLGVKNGNAIIYFKGVKEDAYSFMINGEECLLRSGDGVVKDNVEFLFEEDGMGLYKLTFSNPKK